MLPTQVSVGVECEVLSAFANQWEVYNGMRTAFG
jgi:hypothetical protein